MPTEYKLKNFQDIIDTVPTARIRDCMAELTDMLVQTKATMELHIKVAAALAKADGKTIPTEIPAGAIRLPEFFTWIDDGKGEVVSVMVNDATKTPFMEIARNMKTGDLNLKAL